jgi:hypothetical protein
VGLLYLYLYKQNAELGKVRREYVERTERVLNTDGKENRGVGRPM